MPEEERKKGLGYFGQLKRPDGYVSTELSIGVTGPEFNWKETEIPALVPTLTRAEIDSLLAGDEPTPAIIEKAKQHALMRIKGGLSPFAQLGEQRPLEKKLSPPQQWVADQKKAGTQDLQQFIESLRPKDWEKDYDPEWFKKEIEAQLPFPSVTVPAAEAGIQKQKEWRMRLAQKRLLKHAQQYPMFYPEITGVEVPDHWRALLEFHRHVEPSKKFRNLPGVQRQKVRDHYFNIELSRLVDEDETIKPEEKLKLKKSYRKAMVPSVGESFIRGLLSPYIEMSELMGGPPLAGIPRLKPGMVLPETIGGVIGVMPLFWGMSAGVSGFLPAAPRALHGALTFTATEIPGVLAGEKDPIELLKAPLYGAGMVGPKSVPVAMGLTGLTAGVLEDKEAALHMAILTGALRGYGIMKPKVARGVADLAARAKMNQMLLKQELSPYQEKLGDVGVSEAMRLGGGTLEEQLAERRKNLWDLSVTRVNNLTRSAEIRTQELGLPIDTLKGLWTRRMNMQDAAQRGNEVDFVKATEEFFNEMDVVNENLELSYTRTFEDGVVELTPTGTRHMEMHPGTDSTHLLMAISDRPLRVDTDRYRLEDDRIRAEERTSKLDEYLAQQLVGRGKAVSFEQLQDMRISREDLPEIIRTMRERGMLTVEPRRVSEPPPAPTTVESIYHPALRYLTAANRGIFSERLREIAGKVHLPIEAQRKLWVRFEKDINEAMKDHWSQYTEEKKAEIREEYEAAGTDEAVEAILRKATFGLSSTKYVEFKTKIYRWEARLEEGEPLETILDEVRAEKIPQDMLPEEFRVRPLSEEEYERAASRARVEADSLYERELRTIKDEGEEVPDDFVIEDGVYLDGAPESAKAMTPAQLEVAIREGRLSAEVISQFTKGELNAEALEANPVLIAETMRVKGVAGTWDSHTRMVHTRGGSMTLEELLDRPDAGERLDTGELVLSIKGDTTYDIIVSKEGKYSIKHKTKSKRKRGPVPRTFEEILDLMYNKGYTLQIRTPDGGWWLTDLDSGETKRYTRRQMEKFLFKERDVPNFTPEYEGPVDPNSFGRVHPAPTDVLPRLVEEIREPFYSRWWKGRKSRFNMYQDAFGFPIADLAYGTAAKAPMPGEKAPKAFEDVLQELRRWNKDSVRKVYNILSVLERGRHIVPLEYLRAGEDPLAKALTSKRLGMTRTELSAALEVEKLALEVLGPDYRKVIAEDVPSYLSVGEVSPELATWMRKYGFRPEYAMDLKSFLTNLLATKVRYDVHPYVDRMTEMIKEIEGADLSRETKSRIQKDIRFYRDRAIAGMLGDREYVSEAIQSFNKKYGLELTGSWTDQLLNLYLMNTYASTMPMRVGLVLRNFCQPFLTTGLYVGNKYLAMGYRRALTQEGWEYARDLGIIDPQVVAFEEALPTKRAGYEEIPEELKLFKGGAPLREKVVRKLAVGALKGRAATRKVYDFGMKAYFTADRMNRVVAANAGYEAVMDLGPKFMKGEISPREFKRQTGIVFLEKASQNEILAPLLDTRNPVESVEACAKRYSYNLHEDTQWIYRAANAPWAMERGGRWGRLAGQFGIWPSSYIQFAKRGVRTGDLTATKDFLARMAFANAAVYLMGKEVFGVDLRNWIVTGPLTYTGGPMVQAIISGIEVLQSLHGAEWRRDLAFRDLEQTVGVTVPLRSFARDVVRALSEEEADEAVKRILGLRPIEK